MKVSVKSVGMQYIMDAKHYCVTVSCTMLRALILYEPCYNTMTLTDRQKNVVKVVSAKN